MSTVMASDDARTARSQRRKTQDHADRMESGEGRKEKKVEKGAKAGFPLAGELVDLCWKVEGLGLRLGMKKGDGYASWSKIGQAVTDKMGSNNRPGIYGMQDGVRPSPEILQALAYLAKEDDREWLIAGKRLTPGPEDLDDDEGNVALAQRLVEQLVRRKHASRDTLYRVFASLDIQIPDPEDDAGRQDAERRVR